jgi:2-dehydro-3-deoxygluconokinase
MADAINPRRAPIISIGECMVELARGADDRFGLAYGGDTFNTAVYLARAGLDVAYATALGDDPYSAGIIALARNENIDTHLAHIEKGRAPGLYLIETSAGERTFHYWRDLSPARELFDGSNGEAVIAAMQGAGLIYLSAVTLSLYAPPALDRLAAALANARASGTCIVMDSNYRPRGWQHDASRARAVLQRYWRLCDVALPTFDDEALLWADADPQATVRRLKDLGVREVAVKLGADGALVAYADTIASVPAPARIDPVDTTGAGDSFNAAYLAARMQGQAPEAAALAGHRLAGVVIRHRGAIAPRDATAAALTP